MQQNHLNHSQHVLGHETGLNCSPRSAAARARLRNARKTFPVACWRKEPHSCNETAPMQRKHLTAPQHVPGHVPGHATVPSAPSTYQGTKPALTVPRAVPQHVSGYETQGKRSPLRANTEPHSCNGALRSQHVSGHETGLKCSPRHAAARSRLRNAGKTCPAACWRKEPYPETKTIAPLPRETAQKDKTAPMQQNHLNHSQHVLGHETGLKCSPRHAAARSRLRNAGKTFPVACWRKELHPCNETAPMQRKHLTAPQHVPGHETGPNRSPRSAAARGWLRFTRKTFPGASLKGKERNHTQETKTTTHSSCETAQNHNASWTKDKNVERNTKPGKRGIII